MKNRYTLFLLYLCIALIFIILLIQMKDLVHYHFQSNAIISPSIYGHFRHNQIATLFLSLFCISILFAREGINRELKRKAYTDITGIKNKHACLEEMRILDCNDNTLNIGFAMFDLNNLKKVNDYYGHEKGDDIIHAFTSLLRQASDKRYFLGRFGGDEFLVIIRHCTEEIMSDYINQVKGLVDRYNKANFISLSFAAGYAISTRDHYYLMDELLSEADKDMYRNKKIMKTDALMTPTQLSKLLDNDRLNFLDRDALTGLFNNDAFLVTVRKVLHMAAQPYRLAMICSDISNFRYINDAYGYQEGNQILIKFANELISQPICLCAGRIYSDNFAFLADISDKSDEEVLALINDWNHHISSTINQSYQGSRLVINSGIYFIQDLDEAIGNALNFANMARKHTKSALQNTLIYTDTLSKLEKKRADMINSFDSALENHEFKIYIQPKIHCQDKSICGAEALVRWQRNNKTIYYPDEFIPILEQTGDIIPMDFYIYEEVFYYIFQRIQALEEIIPIALNVSRVHLFNPGDFILRIQALLKKYPISSSMIIFELTENTFIQNMNSAQTFINELHALGFKVSMDDFGSGYSSLEVLKNLPFDEIKFDKYFLVNNTDANSRNILQQMIRLVKSLQKNIVCEGVETLEQADFLSESDCDIMQGFYFYRPIPIDEFSRLLPS